MSEKTEYHSTPAQFEQFFKTSVWRDLKEIVEGQMSGDLIMLENDSDIGKIRWAQGRVHAFKGIINLEDFIVKDMLIEKQNKEEESNG